MGTVEVILRFSLQIPKMEKCEKQMLIYADIGGNLEEILHYSFQIPMMEKFVEATQRLSFSSFSRFL